MRIARIAALLLCALPLPVRCAAQAAPSSAPSSANTTRPANAAATSEVFTTAVANDLLFQLAQGMESRNARLALGAFDAAKLSGYSRLSDQMDACFRQYTSFRVYYKLKQVSAEVAAEGEQAAEANGARGVALVDFEYEATPSAPGAAPLRRHQQMRFSFARGPKGWKIVEFSPRGLFS